MKQLTCQPPLSGLQSANSSREFHGLPPEILQYIVNFLPFHDLVKVYTSLPKIHRPIIQQQLDYSLALMILTLEIKQDARGPTDRNTTTTTSATASLPTQWRVTAFDADRMWVEFQLEAKLGMEMAERRRQEVLQQYQEFSSKKSSSTAQRCRRDLRAQSNSTSIPILCDHTRSKAQCQYPSLADDIESVIWKSRRRRDVSDRRRTVFEFAMSPADALDQEDHVVDSNFFHCDKSCALPALESARISFKAHRNTPARWITSWNDHLNEFCGTSMSTTDSSPVGRPSFFEVESPRARSARERKAAFMQDHVLLRVLSRMTDTEASSAVQFLPRAVELDTRNLGQRRTKAVVLSEKPWLPNHRLGRQREEEKRRAASSKVNRRHSWHPESVREQLSFFTRESEQFSTALKGLLERSSWNGSGPRGWLSYPIGATTEMPDYHYHRWQDEPFVIGGWDAAEWMSALSSMATSIYRSCREFSGPRSDKGIAITTASCGHLEEEDTAEEKEAKEEDALFEFTYDVRHNYILSNRLEGERVVRPIRFACSLDFFVPQGQGA
ncbi:hypothetical protein BGZ54_008882 [Gamsiella multidivaricata]|nr:hypothetical protein BGZ54_008882 [Gamsiella multidivaricata]